MAGFKDWAKEQVQMEKAKASAGKPVLSKFDIEAAKIFKQDPLRDLRGLLGADPDKITAKSVESSLERFRTTLLGGRSETDLDTASQTLLTQGSEIAGKITARLQSFEKKQATPGVQAQTSIVGKTSLLGK